ncbi:hypothetical protein P5V15_013159 [Pogonomyrmex californicus]
MFNSIKHLLRYNPNKFGCQLLAYFSAETTVKSNLTQRECTRVYPQVCGQPTSTTHPHLIKQGEVLPGISLQELKRRRSKLVESISLTANAKNVRRQQIVVIPASSTIYMSNKIPYVFRQNTDFLYFSGCQEPDSILVLTCKEDKSSYTLFVRPKDEHSELWDGPRTGVEMAAEMFGTDYALPVTEFEQFLTTLVQEDKSSVVWYDHADIVQPILHKKLCQLIKLTDNQIFASPKILFHQIRLIKSACEIDLMRESCGIASKAIVKTIQSSKPEMSEHQLFATVDYECRMLGAKYLAYPPVVAGGKNATVIHYISNNQIIRDGDLVLMDAGIYVSPRNPYASSRFHGLGIRIEDDVLITENDSEILTKNCPKEVAEIEALAS